MFSTKLASEVTYESLRTRLSHSQHYNHVISLSRSDVTFSSTYTCNTGALIFSTNLNLRPSNLTISAAAAVLGENQNHTFPFLICKFMDAGLGSCVVKEVSHRETIDGCRFDCGDCAIAVQWFSRDPADPLGRTFERVEKGILNSTELRLCGFNLKKVSIAVNFSQVELSDDEDVPLGDSLTRDTFEIDVPTEQSILDKCW